MEREGEGVPVFTLGGVSPSPSVLVEVEVEGSRGAAQILIPGGKTEEEEGRKAGR